MNWFSRGKWDGNLRDAALARVVTAVVYRVRKLRIGGVGGMECYFIVFLGDLGGGGVEQGAFGQHQVGEGKERVELGGVLGETSVTHFAKAKQVLDHMKGVFDFGADLRLEAFELLGQLLDPPR